MTLDFQENPEMLPTIYAATYRNKKSRGLNLNILKRYIEITTEKAVADVDQAWIEYLSKGKPQIISDLMTFHTRCEDLYCSITINQYLATVERYLDDCCGVKLSAKQIRMRKNSLPKGQVETRDIVLDGGMIKQMLLQADTRMRALILILCSSGMRISEALNILPEYVNTSKNPTEIYIPAKIAKNGHSRITYISDEATEAYTAWMTVRDHEVEISLTQQPNYKKANEGKANAAVFPYTANNERYRFYNVLEKAGLYIVDPVTHRSRIIFHSFRKFFISQFKLVASPAVAEMLAGHEGYLDGAYRRIPEAELQAEYLKAMPRLMINVPDDYYKVKVEQADEISKLQISAADQQHMINQLLDELRQLRRQQEVMNVTGVLPRSSLQNDEYEGL